MKLPRYVEIQGKRWTVSLVPPDELTLGGMGEIDSDERTIKVSCELSREDQTHVFLHELRHAHHHETKFDEILDPQAEELDCENFASLLTSLFYLTFKRSKRKKGS